MARYSYAFQGFDATKHVRASIREKKISHKHARETAKAIKGLTLEKARDYMLSVIAKERAIPFARFKNQVGHRSCLLYTSPSPRDQRGSRMPSSA